GTGRAIRLGARDIGSGTMSLAAPLPVVPIVVSVVVAPLLARLVERVAASARDAPPSVTMLGPAVDLPAVAAPADVEDAPAPRAPPLPTDLRSTLVHRRSNGATGFLLFWSASATVPASGTSRRSDPRVQAPTWALSLFVTPRVPNLPAAPRRGRVRVGFPRILMVAYIRDTAGREQPTLKASQQRLERLTVSELHKAPAAEREHELEPEVHEEHPRDRHAELGPVRE